MMSRYTGLSLQSEAEQIRQSIQDILSNPTILKKITISNVYESLS